MAILKCKMCGGNLEVTEESTVAICEYCGTKQTVPSADNEKKMMMFERANKLRYQCEFDKAAGMYENIITDFPYEAEAYWGLVLCKYGIEYVDDPATGKKLPTCHRSSFDSVMEDSNFEKVTENADVLAVSVYRSEAKAIEELRKSILEVSSKEDPYDIFICYKETDDAGERTIDSVIAQEIYNALTEQGYRVFFSRITLEDKLGTAYEPYIFAALNSAKVMLAVGTSFDHYYAVWVKNEWSRFLQLIAKGEKKTLIPCYKNIDAYDIPKEFKHLQGQDMGKVGALQDLLRGIGKILSSAKPKPDSPKTDTSASTDANVKSLLKRVFLYLEDGKWSKSEKYAERVLDIDPENAEAYLGKLLADLHVRRKEDLVKQKQVFDENENYKKTVRFADDKLRNELVGFIDHIIQEENRKELERKERVYNDAVTLINNANTIEDYIEAKEAFEQALPIHDSEEMINKCDERIEYLRLVIKAKNEEKCCLFNKLLELPKRIKLLSAELQGKRIQYELGSKKRELENELSGLGIFAFSRKKEINAELEKIMQQLKETQRKYPVISNDNGVLDNNTILTQIESELSQAKRELAEVENTLWKGGASNEKKTLYGTQRGTVLYIGDRLIKNSIIENNYWGFGKDLKESNILFIVIPNTVKGIGKEAFHGCGSLISVYIPESVTSIGEEAFSGCDSLTSIYIPESVTSIGKEAFYGCESLTSIHIPKAVTSIGYDAFRNCNNLTKITVDPMNKSYDSRGNCNALIKTDKNELLCGCCSTEIPNTITIINGSAFWCCRNLSNIIIPNSVKSIGGYAFYGCKSLTSIHIPESVISIGNNSFLNCDNLTKISVDPMNKKYDSRDDCNAVIESNRNNLLIGCSSTIIPESVTSIGNGAFESCDNLTGIRIPESVTSIGDRAFESCDNLTSIRIPKSVTSIGYSAFENCYNLTSISVDPLNTTYDSRGNCNAVIESDTDILLFGCSTTTIPESISSIGEKAFYYCEDLMNICIPDSVTSIENYAFSHCYNLISINIPNGVTSIGDSAFECCHSLTRVIIPDSVMSIGEHAFSGCQNLTRIDIPDSVSEIEDSAFFFCDNLTIYGKRGSAAEENAKENDIPFRRK